MKQIKNALISVYHKEGILPLLKKMVELDIRLFSTGGTHDFIRSAGLQVTPVEEITGYPSIFGGRVKTLHPSVMGGILCRRDHPVDAEECQKYNIQPIDLVVVDLYPFEETVQLGRPSEEIIEQIDIGGISLIRAAAKNFNDVVIIPDRQFYPLLSSVLDEGGSTSPEFRRNLAALAFDISSGYDAAIYRYFSQNLDTPSLKISSREVTPLRYGENPHQRGFFYGKPDAMIKQLHGKEISYNNLLDIHAAMSLIDEFREPTVAILKHNNACGLASRASLSDAWDAALAADPLSAYGGIIVTNRMIQREVAEKINKIFFEVIIAPEFDTDALEILSEKKNRIILKNLSSEDFSKPLRNVLNGYLVQDPDDTLHTAGELKTATRLSPTARQKEDLLFANIIVKHTKSNAIVIVNNKQLVGIGTGQTSRVDAMKQAIAKARDFGLPLENAVSASDAFFPFPDSIEYAWLAGIRAVIQPGGSVKDQLSIDFCNNHDIAMVFTGIRHFKH
jgi:phosphoribosylaminoimidazolecarboxamide formyltransferase / IMP cyclohydrolase